MTTRRCRQTAIVVGLTLLLSAAGAGTAFAADPGGGLLDPLNVRTSEGAPLDHYDLVNGDPTQSVPLPGTVDGGGTLEAVQMMLASGLFAAARTVTGLACWLIDWAYKFPVLDKLTGPAQKISDAYETNILGPLGLAGLFITWAFVFGLVLAMRGRVARGTGEILLTLLISALAATTVVRPTVLLGYDGPVQQTQRAALEAATITTNAGSTPAARDTGPCALVTGPAKETCLRNQAKTKPSPPSSATGPTKQCDTVTGPARDTCLSNERPPTAAAVSQPITRTLTDTLVVQPYMLLQYGRTIEKDSPLYPVHQSIVTKTTDKPDPDSPCNRVKGPAKEVCLRGGQDATGKFDNLGDEGKAVTAYMGRGSWDRVIGAALVLIAAIVIFLLVLAMAMALIAAQIGCVIAALGNGIVFTWALLPGPNRAVLWRWLGSLAACMLTLLGVAIAIPLFGLIARALLADTSTPLLERLFLLDGVAAAALVAHRLMKRSAHRTGQTFASRMRFSRIGGSHTMNENAASTAAAFSSLGYSGAAGSPAHTSLLSRAGRNSTLGALTEGTGGPGGMLVAAAVAEGRHALAPLALGLRAAHTALIGPKRPPVQPEPVGPDGLVLPHSTRTPGKDRAAAAAPTAAPGRAASAPSAPETEGTGRPPLVPAGSRLEASLRRTRAGRVLVGTSKAAFYSTVGLPATWTRLRSFGDEMSRDLNTELGRQRAHYQRVGGRWADDTAAAFAPRHDRDSRHQPRTERRSYRATSTKPPRTRRARRPEAGMPSTRTPTADTPIPGDISLRTWRELWREHDAGGGE
ncbi:hypothetical protein ACWGN5_35800 [Streptomyces sp. NPDC055815]